MTFDREPDLDNANVGMPDTDTKNIGRNIEFTEAIQRVASFFVAIFTEDKKNGKGKRNRA